MLQPDREYTFLFDKASMRPACVIVQALYGCDSAPIHLFPEWQTAPVPTLVRVKGTGREIEEFAKEMNAVIR